MYRSARNGMLTLVVSILVAGCASTPAGEEADVHSSLPSWISTPSKEVAEGALAATECVRNNAGMSILKAKATALARASIAKQIQVKVQALDKNYQTLTENGQESGSGSSFETVSKQVTDQMLQGAIPERVDYIGNGKQLCVMVVLSPEKNKKVFKSIIQASERQLTPDNEALLYQEYRAKRAQDELESSLNGE